MSSSVTQLKVDLAALRRAEVTLEAASASILATKQDQGSLQACVGDAPKLRDALGRLSGNWAIHRERLLSEIEGLKSNITTYRTKIETLDDQTAKAITGQGSEETIKPQPSSGPPPPTPAPTPAGTGGGTPSPTPPTPPTQPSHAPEHPAANPEVPRPVPDSLQPPIPRLSPDPSGPDELDPELRNAIDADSQTVAALLDRWSAEAKLLMAKGLPLTLLGPAAIALLTLYGRMPTPTASERIGQVGGDMRILPGETPGDMDPIDARAWLQPLNPSAVGPDDPTDAEQVDNVEADAIPPSPNPATPVASGPDPGDTLNPAAAAATVAAAGVGGAAATAAGGGSDSGGRAGGSSDGAPSMRPPAPTPAAPLPAAAEANTFGEGRSARADASQAIGAAATHSAGPVTSSAPVDARTALGATSPRVAMAGSSQVMQSAVGSLTALSQVGQGHLASSAGTPAQPAATGSTGGTASGATSGGSSSSTAQARLAALKERPVTHPTADESAEADKGGKGK